MRYIVPEMEIRAFAHEDIVTGSGNDYGDSVKQVMNDVDTANTSYNGSGAVVADWSTGKIMSD